MARLVDFLNEVSRSPGNCEPNYRAWNPLPVLKIFQLLPLNQLRSLRLCKLPGLCGGHESSSNRAGALPGFQTAHADSGNLSVDGSPGGDGRDGGPGFKYGQLRPFEGPSLFRQTTSPQSEETSRYPEPNEPGTGSLAPGGLGGDKS